MSFPYKTCFFSDEKQQLTSGHRTTGSCSCHAVTVVTLVAFCNLNKLRKSVQKLGRQNKMTTTKCFRDQSFRAKKQVVL